jgi:hypothetical protein
MVGALKTLGLNGRHAGKTLSEGTGSDPQRHRWQRNEDGRYTLHPEDAQA